MAPVPRRGAPVGASRRRQPPVVGEAAGDGLGDGDEHTFFCTAILTVEPSGLGVPAAGTWLTTAPKQLPVPVYVTPGLNPAFVSLILATLSVSPLTSGTLIMSVV